MWGATKALVLADESAARDVIRVHDELTARTVEAQASALQLLVRHEGDLPGLSVSLQIIGDLDQIDPSRTARRESRPPCMPRARTARRRK